MVKRARAILLDPEMRRHPALAGDPLARALFVDLLLLANAQPEPYDMRLNDGTVIPLRQGELYFNLAGWAAENGVSYKAARVRLEKLKRHGTVTAKTTPKGNGAGQWRGNVVTVVNFGSYQTLAEYGFAKGNGDTGAKGNGRATEGATARGNGHDAQEQPAEPHGRLSDRAKGNGEGQRKGQLSVTQNITQKKQLPPASPWAVSLASEIAAHVTAELGVVKSDKQVEAWAHDLERLTRSTVLVPQPNPTEIQAVVSWALQDRRQGAWTGWAAQTRSAPDAERFARLRRAMDDCKRAPNGNPKVPTKVSPAYVGNDDRY